MLQSLLQSALWQRSFSLQGRAVCWHDLLQQLSHQTVLELCAPVIFTIKEEGKPGQDLLWQLTSDYLFNQKSYQQHCDCIAHICQAMQAAGCQPVLKKGIAIASLYPVPQDRRIGDIDLFVATSEYETALAALQALATPAELAAAEDTSDHYQIFLGEIEIELHRQAMAMPTDTITLSGVQVAIPAPTEHCIYLFTHLWHHFAESNGVGLRQVCDMAILLHRLHTRIDNAQLLSYLQQHSLYNVWQALGWIMVNWLGLPAAECPLYQGKAQTEGRKLLAFIIREGNFGDGTIQFKQTLKQQHPLLHKWYAYRYFGKRQWLVDVLTQSSHKALMNHVAWIFSKTEK